MWETEEKEVVTVSAAHTVWMVLLTVTALPAPSSTRFLCTHLPGGGTEDLSVTCPEGHVRHSLVYRTYCISPSVHYVSLARVLTVSFVWPIP